MAVSISTLLHITLAQALADVAVFLEAFIKNNNLPSDISVVTFGGSYAGMLSGFFRSKYPTLAIGAVGSSAPVCRCYLSCNT